MKILVVDDDLTNRLVLKAMLEKDSHDVVLAEDGEQGVALFESERPDMVLMDVMMPVMDGYGATRLIKEKSANYFVPVIFITAVTEDSALADCVKCGGDDFITKPFNRIILRAKIAALERIRALYGTIIEQKNELETHNERILREQELAEKIYENIVYQGTAVTNCINGINKPAEMFSGDVMLVAYTPSGSINVLMGDVTGHGLSAAICVMPVAEIFYSMSSKGFSIQDIVVEINYRLKKLLPTGMFLATALVQIDSECHLVRAWNGGLPDIYIYGEKDGIRRIASMHLPIGIVDGEDFDSDVGVFEVTPGDRILLYTDGLIEAASRHGKMYTQEKLGELISANKAAGTVLEKLESSLHAHCDGDTAKDDITVVEIICDPDLMKEKQDIEQLTQYHLAKTWRVELELKTDALRTTDPIPLLMQLIIGIQGFSDHRSNLFAVLSELYNNAFDHGVLNMDSTIKSSPEGFMEYYVERERRISELAQGEVKLIVANTPCDNGGCLTMTIEDSGKGFAYHKYEATLDENEGNSGRGVPLVKSLCKNLVYSKNGSRVEAGYYWE